jgi:dCMP deaminase
MKRISWDEMFTNLSVMISLRATCPRLQVGCVLVYKNKVVSMGYNGAPAGTPHCVDEECIIVGGHCVRSVHAEENAALFLREQFDYLTAYVTHNPCVRCVKALYQVNVKEIVYLNEYEDKARDDMFRDTGFVQFRKFDGALLINGPGIDVKVCYSCSCVLPDPPHYMCPLCQQPLCNNCMCIHHNASRVV